MVSTFTPNINLEEPARGDYVGTWDTPVNSNETVTDLVLGGITVISLNNSPVVLSAAQFQCATITFLSTLTGSVAITFPTSFKKAYTLFNLCTGSSAFTITLQTTATGTQVICVPPGDVQVLNDGSNMNYLNLGRVGTFWDYAGSSVPLWVSGCAKPPFLNCDGTVFSSATYPQLAVIMGGTTLPDTRGRVRATLNQTTGRLTAAGGGVDGNTNYAAGGVETITLAASQIAAHSHAATDSGHTHGTERQNGVGMTPGTGSGGVAVNSSIGVTATGNANITVANSTGGGPHINVQPTFMGGLTLIRSA